MKQHMRLNTPELRNINSNLHKEQVHKGWETQRAEHSEVNFIIQIWAFFGYIGQIIMLKLVPVYLARLLFSRQNEWVKFGVW